MSKSLTQSKKTKWSTPGIESNYEEFIKNLKEKLIHHINENRLRYFEQEQLDFRENNRQKKTLNNLLTSIGTKEPQTNETQPSLVEHDVLKNSLMTEPGVDMNDFNAFFTQYIEQTKSNIKNSISIDLLLSGYQEDIKCKGGIEKSYASSLMREELHKLILAESTSNFKISYKHKWYASFKSYKDPLEWLSFIDNEVEAFPDQKSLFQYYWNIYRSYRKYNSDLAEDNISQELMKKCIQYRIKLRVDKTEKEMIDLIIRWSMIKLLHTDEPIFSIHPVKNFVLDAFACHDIHHSTRTYQYELNIPVAAHFILLIRHLFETDMFTITTTREHKSDSNYKKIEFQLWLEFTFRNCAGFGKDNIERYFTDSEENMKGRNFYNEIKDFFD